MLAQLSRYVDPLALKYYLGTESKFGKRPHAEPWGYTRAYLATYGDPEDLPAVCALFAELGITDEITATRVLIKHNSLLD